MYLVDTNVISALAPTRAAPAVLAAWLELHTDSLFLSVVTIAEIRSGIARTKREGAFRKSADLTLWLKAVVHLYAARILSFDLATAGAAGDIADLARGGGTAPGFADIIIAATARQHGLTILTRNLRHFTPLNVPALDPFSSSLPG